MSILKYSFITLLFYVFSQVFYETVALPKVNPIDDVKPLETLAVHNEIRAAVGVKPLVWNETVAAAAQKYANKRKDCGGGHSGGIYGENIAAGWGDMSGPVATKFWLTEKPNYDYATNKCKGPCGHYTQIVANQSLSVGCGATRCHNNEYIWIVCNYHPMPVGDANTRPYLQQ